MEKLSLPLLNGVLPQLTINDVPIILDRLVLQFLVKMLDFDITAATENERMFDDVLQFSNIAGEVVFQKKSLYRLRQIAI